MDRQTHLDAALAQIERQFGGNEVSEEERAAKWVERGFICSTCQKRGTACTCDCGCKYCWGSLWGKNSVR